MSEKDRDRQWSTPQDTVVDLRANEIAAWSGIHLARFVIRLSAGLEMRADALTDPDQKKTLILFAQSLEEAVNKTHLEISLIT